MKRSTLFIAVAGMIAGVVVALLQFGALVALAPQVIRGQVPAVQVGEIVGGDWALPLLGAVAGVIAGWLALRGATDGPIWRGLRAGAAAGAGIFIGVTLAFAGLLAMLGADPAVQEFIRMSEPHPEARLAPAAIPWLGGVVGALLGLFAGGKSLLAAILGGLVVDLLHERRVDGAPHPAH
ncbi:MAG: hypothetical protein HGA45_02875 [Chloroflexales bacterium]|nr:hypothetical protein [Chloroflexales bacterium]